MQAIQTKFIGPTNTKGSRYKAWCDAGSVTVSADYSVDYYDNHVQAAQALRVKLGWNQDYGRLASGSLPNGDYCHVFVMPSTTTE